MKVTELSIEGLKLIDISLYKDDRGFFSERFKQQSFLDHGLPANFIQDNFSRSAPRVLRGLHYQFDKPQGKLVTCMRGSIFDVAVDLRKNSKTFGQHVTVELSCSNPQWFWIPAGFAHGFCVLGEEPADVFYKVDNYYNAKGEDGIVWNDADLQIKWPLERPNLSGKDQILKNFSEYAKDPKFSC